ncbi:MAG: hypothetical protein HC921_21025 [Synechococcaceae cyanobacterium SM2_3_1]|nr:hypothetical protein [Synechococcaceae cyanobacterium SM2_3_1]
MNKSVNNISYDPCKDPVDADEFYDIIESQQNIDDFTVRRIPTEDLSDAKKFQYSLGRMECATSRISTLKELSEERWPEPIKYLLNIAVGSLGALILGSGVATLMGATGRGTLAVAGGAMGGGAVALVGDAMLSKQFTRWKLNRAACQAMRDLQNDLQNSYYLLEVI